MSNTILVTYTSRTGYTVGVAETIGKTLVESGLPVDVLPMAAVTDLTRYSAVIAGSAVQDRQWLPEAVQFVRSHQAELKRKPFAAFLVCMTLAMKNGERYRPEVEKWLNPVRDLVPTVSTGCFAGGLEISRIPSLRHRLMFRMSVMMGVWSEGDHRDWAAIQAWAAALKPKLAGFPA